MKLGHQLVQRARLPLRTGAWDRAIEALDPRTHSMEIVHILSNHIFPIEMLLALEIAQLRTFTIPTISKLLHATKQYEAEGVKRLDDTRAILTEILRPGLDSPASREMVEHLNQIHAAYTISNDDYLYTLSTFVFDPALFVDKWGHRPMTERERDAIFFVYRRLGERMRIRDLPATRGELWTWRRSYEASAQTYAPENEQVARGLLRAVASLVPPVLGPYLEPLVVVLTDDEPFRWALGLAPPPRRFTALVRRGMQLYRRVARYASPFEHAPFLESPMFARYATYPRGYDRLRLGPTKVLAMLAKQRAASGAR